MSASEISQGMSAADPDEALAYVAAQARDVEARRRALEAGGRWNLKQRIRWIRRLDDLVRRSRSSILEIVASEKGGSADGVLLTEYPAVRFLLREHGRTAARLLNEENRSRPLSLYFWSKKVTVRKEPLGIVGVISPFNYPLALPLGAVAPALLAGNGVFLKPPEQTPRANDLVRDLIARSLAEFGGEGLFTMLPTSIAFGEAIVSCPGVHKVHFTGSVAAGWKVCQANARVRLTPPTLELGGSNAAIVLDDADLDGAARVIVWARFSALSCNSIKRVFAVDPIYDPLCERLDRLTEALDTHEILTRYEERERERFQEFLRDCRRRFGDAVAPSSDDVRPTILKLPRYEPDALVLREETFVPLLPVVRTADAGEALRLANDSRFGLGATVFTRSRERFRALAARLDVGGVYQDDALVEFAQAQVPFGGTKESGWGFRHGPEGLLDFTRRKVRVEERRVLGWTAPRLHLYPWRGRKMSFLRRFLDHVIRLS